MKLTISKNQNVYFTSDTHYDHANICRATTSWKESENLTRDFKSLDHMNDTLVNNINSMVGEDDILIHLGDWSFGGFDNIKEFRDRIVCKNIHLILGNHDHHIARNKGDIQSIFSSVNHYVMLDLRRPSAVDRNKVDKWNFVLMHFPIASWEGMNIGVPHLHGHVHLPPDKRLGKGKSLDVGVDGNGLKPIKLETVLSLIKDQPIDKLCLPTDHHVKRI